MKAYQLIDSPKKWSQGFYHENGQYCAVGAYAVAYGFKEDSGGWVQAGDELRTKLAFLPSTDWAEDWNDMNDWSTVYNTLKDLDI